MSSEQYQIIAELPTAEEHLRLRAVAGLTIPPGGLATCAKALPNSYYCVVARETSTGKAVGMARVIGDGALFMQVVDVAVDPEHQRKGLGGRLMKQVEKHIDEDAPNAYVSLLADPPGVPLYKKHGFELSVCAPMKRSDWMT